MVLRVRTVQSYKLCDIMNVLDRHRCFEIKVHCTRCRSRVRGMVFRMSVNPDDPMFECPHGIPWDTVTPFVHVNEPPPHVEVPPPVILAREPVPPAGIQPCSPPEPIVDCELDFDAVRAMLAKLG
jgi:hypothetical protein